MKLKLNFKEKQKRPNQDKDQCDWMSTFWNIDYDLEKTMGSPIENGHIDNVTGLKFKLWNEEKNFSKSEVSNIKFSKR